jgi:hypothetical protein
LLPVRRRSCTLAYICSRDNEADVLQAKVGQG